MPNYPEDEARYERFHQEPADNDVFREPEEEDKEA